MIDTIIHPKLSMVCNCFIFHVTCHFFKWRKRKGKGTSHRSMPPITPTIQQQNEVIPLRSNADTYRKWEWVSKQRRCDIDTILCLQLFASSWRGRILHQRIPHCQVSTRLDRNNSSTWIDWYYRVYPFTQLVVEHTYLYNIKQVDQTVYEVQ